MKKILFLLLMLCLAGKVLIAQKVIDPDRDTSLVFTKAEKMPMFKGGDTAWIHFLNKNLKYPPEAIDNEMKGNVIVGFTVNRDGTLNNIEAISSPGKPLSTEAIRILTLSSGNWLPATQNGYIVKCHARKTIQFRLLSN